MANLGYPVTAVSIDPGNPDVVYAGLDGAGVYRSIDGGMNWSPSNIDIQSTSIMDIAVDPYNSSRVLAVSLNKVYLSENAGVTWLQVGQGTIKKNKALNKITLNPADFSLNPLPSQT
ncbi:MAG: hypothetical protein GWN77_02875, partial [Gammaproteobacteria bacterium]|nr:hypothetical protein [Gammaproteobacteria bacterium]